MSDDFDNNNDWLPNDDEPMDESGDDQDFGWLPDDDEDAVDDPLDARHLGVTGELSWLGGDDDDDSETFEDDDNLSFDWGSDQPSGRPGHVSTGLTGMLDWQDTGQSSDDQSDEQDSDFDGAPWLPDDDSDLDDEPAAGAGKLMPDWLRNLGGDTEDEKKPPSRAGGFDEELPDWLTATGTGEVPVVPEDEEEPGTGMPVWLSGAAEDDTSYTEEPEDEGALPDWLRTHDEVSTPAASDDWLDDETVHGEPAAEDDFLSHLGSSLPGSAPDEDDFSYLRSYGDGKTGELGEHDEQAAATGAELPDWFDDEVGDVPDTTPPPLASFDDMDFESLFADPDAEDVLPDFDDLVGEEAASSDAMDMDSFFDEVDESVAAVGLDDDTFEDIFGEDVDDVLAEFEDEAEGGPMALDDLFGDEAAALAGHDDTFDDLSLDEFDDEAALEDLFGDEESDEAPAVPTDLDTLRQMGIDPTAQKDDRDWFAEEDTGSGLNWLEEIGDVTDLRAEPQADNLLDDLGDLEDIPELAEELPEDLSEQEIDSFLASLDSAPVDLPSTGELSLLTGGEFDDLFAEGTFAAMDRHDEGEIEADKDALPQEGLEWLTELSVSEAPATSLLRKRDERPLEDLPERLQELHERGEQLATTQPEEDRAGLDDLLPDVDGIIAPALITIGDTQVTTSPQITPEQRGRAQLLHSLVGAAVMGEAAEDLSAEYDWSQDAVVPVAAAKPRAKTRTRVFKIDRLLIALLLLGVIAVPFFVNTVNIGDLPPNRFAADSDQQAAFAAVDGLQAGDLVLVGVEYGPTTAAELDSATDALLRHVLAKGARPVLMGSNPVGLLHAGNILNAIGTGDDAPFLAQLNRAPFATNQDYYVTRYLTASVIGLRNIERDMPRLLETDIRGNSTGLADVSLDDFALLIVIAENAEELRAWAEQVVPLTDSPLVAVTSFAASPLSRPYIQAAKADSRVAGMLTGYRDAYTYGKMVNALVFGEALPPTVDTTGSEIPSTTEPGVTPVATIDQGEPAAASSTPSAPSLTPQISATPTQTITSTPAPTRTFTPTATPLPLAVVNSGQAVNVRGGAGTTFAPVGVIQPGAQVTVLGENADGTWLNVRLPDGSEGWVFASLMDVLGSPTAQPLDPTPTAETLREGSYPSKTERVSFADRLKVLAQEASPTPEVFESFSADASATPAVTMTSTPSLTPRPEVTLAVEPDRQGAVVRTVTSTQATAQQDKRWYAMTLGLIATVLIIAVGTLFNMVRSLFRRNRS